MEKKRKKKTQKIFLVWLMFVLAAGILPVTALADGEGNPKGFTIMVKENGTALPGAEVDYTIWVGDKAAVEKNVIAANGSVVVSELAGYAEQIQAGNVKISCMVRREGYQISEVALGGQAQALTGPDTFEISVTAKNDMEISVTLVKVYTVTVEYDKEMGRIKTAPEMVSGVKGGTVTVAEGKSLTVTATPEKGYRVSKVVKNKKEETYTENDKGYTDTVEKIEEDYTYEITFAPNRFKVSVSANGNSSWGTVSCENLSGTGAFLTDLHTTPSITVQQKEGYHVSSVTVDGEEKADALVEQEMDGRYLLSLPPVTGDVAVNVTFAEDETVKAANPPFQGEDYEVTFQDANGYAQNPVRTYTNGQGQKVYVFAKDVKAAVKPKNGYTHVRINGAGERCDGIELSSEELQRGKTIEEITVGKGEKGYRTPKHIVMKIKLVVDAGASKITLTPEAANANGIYSHDVKVDVQVSDAVGKSPEDYSGIRTVEYEVRNGNKITQKETYVLGGGDSKEWKTSQNEPTDIWNFQIQVDAVRNNSCNVSVTVTAVDNAGNKSSKSLSLDIDSTHPSIAISYDNNRDNQGNGYFNAARTATVKIMERTEHFDEKAATEGIKIRAVDAAGKQVKLNRDTVISEWRTVRGASPDEDIHIAAVTCDTDANYTLSVSYTDKAGNTNVPVDTGNSQAPWKFTVDRTAPVGTLKARTAEGRAKTWDGLPGVLTFGFWSAKKITVTGTASDATSPIESVFYYKGAQNTALTTEQLRQVTEWKEFHTVTVKTDEQFTIYLKITDLAGNESYLGSDGMIVDDRRPRVKSVAPQITITPEQPVNGFYTRDVRVKIKVQDPGNVYSGLKNIRYQVFNMGEETQRGTLYSFTKEKPKRRDLKKGWNGEITVDSRKNNSNQVMIRVYAEDNAGNVSQRKRKIKIDITAPQISVSYDNNSPDGGKYYKRERVATITVTERNFDAEAVNVAIQNTAGAAPVVTGWREVKGTGNMDDTRHTATVTYRADGDYTFSITYTDAAGNQCPGAVYAAGTMNPEKFTIDRTAPVITVSYDNNAAQNGKYFKEKRTGTVTVTERNFDKSRVKFTQTASLGGRQLPVPDASWSSSGDTHTAVFSYEADGAYTFDVTMEDLAGNQSGEAFYGKTVAGKEFTVDTGIEKPVIEGVENGKAYRGEVLPVIRFSDENFAKNEIRLLRTRKGEKDIDVTEEFIKDVGRNEDGVFVYNGIFAKVPENDGIYTLTAAVSDMAGNKAKEEVIFTVNRFGSVYVFDEYLVSLRDVYTQQVENSLIITEYNPNRLREDSVRVQISRDGVPLTNVKYTVNPAVNGRVKAGESGWYQYEYKIDAENFAEDGIYRLGIASEDEAGNRPETLGFEEGDVMFRVDTTPAEITNVTGLENPIVNARSRNVDFTVFDAVGLKSIAVYVDDEKVKIYENLKDSINFSGSVVISSGADRKIRLVVEDLAGNITDTDEKAEDGRYVFQPEFAFVRKITVSTNLLVRWYANRLLFWGTMGAVGVLTLLFFLLLRIRREKKE